MSITKNVIPLNLFVIKAWRLMGKRFPRLRHRVAQLAPGQACRMTLQRVEFETSG